MKPIRVEAEIHFQRQERGHRVLVEGPPEDLPRPSGRIPRVTRLMALAIRFDGLIKAGKIDNQAELAQLGNVSRARVTQIMNLLMLAPDIQEDLLFLPRVESGRDPLHLRQLQPIAAIPDWRKQRSLWTEQSDELKYRSTSD